MVRYMRYINGISSKMLAKPGEPGEGVKGAGGKEPKEGAERSKIRRVVSREPGGEGGSRGGEIIPESALLEWRACFQSCKGM